MKKTLAALLLTATMAINVNAEELKPNYTAYGVKVAAACELLLTEATRCQRQLRTETLDDQSCDDMVTYMFFIKDAFRNNDNFGRENLTQTEGKICVAAMRKAVVAVEMITIKTDVMEQQEEK